MNSNTIMDRVLELEELTGKDINELLGRYAETVVDCNDCPILEKCSRVSDYCWEIWRKYLEGAI